jgi:hypothetical protein
LSHTTHNRSRSRGWSIVTIHRDDPRHRWKSAARNWRGWLRLHGLDDTQLTRRPTERAAFANLEAQAHAGDTVYALPLSPYEMDIYALEQTFLSSYRTGAFIKTHGILSLGQKYAWIAAQRPSLNALTTRAILDDIHYALESYTFDVAVRNIRALYVMPEP